MTVGRFSPQIVGPFLPEYRVTIDGFQVPYVNARLLDDGRIDVTVDNRFSMSEPVPREEFDRWIHIVANAMAVAAGYSSHGENCTPLNPFTVRMSQIGGEPEKPKLTVVDGDKVDPQ